MDKIKNILFRESMKIALLREKLRINRLCWYRHAIRKYERHVPSRMISIAKDGCRSRRRVNKIWIDFKFKY